MLTKDRKSFWVGIGSGINLRVCGTDPKHGYGTEKFGLGTSTPGVVQYIINNLRHIKNKEGQWLFLKEED